MVSSSADCSENNIGIINRHGCFRGCTDLKCVVNKGRGWLLFVVMVKLEKQPGLLGALSVSNCILLLRRRKKKTSASVSSSVK